MVTRIFDGGGGGCRLFYLFVSKSIFTNIFGLTVTHDQDDDDLV